MAATLPDKPGYYLWWMLDLDYLRVGIVHVLHDPPSHLARFVGTDKGPFTYTAPDGRLLSMYHEAHDAIPPCGADKNPWVDGYMPFDMARIK